MSVNRLGDLCATDFTVDRVYRDRDAELERGRFEVVQTHYMVGNLRLDLGRDFTSSHSLTVSASSAAQKLPPWRIVVLDLLTLDM